MTDFDYSDFLNPYNPSSEFNSDDKKNRELLLNSVKFFTNESDSGFINNQDLVIIGVNDNRNTQNKGVDKAADAVRSELYRLYSPGKIQLCDLGNLKTGKTVKDTYSALTEVIYNLLINEIAIILIGGSKDLIIPVCNSYEKGKKYFSLCTAESRFCLNDNNSTSQAESYLSYLIENNRKLFNYSNIGFQSYYNSVENINYIQEEFESVRLGMARTFIFQNEPYIRDADFFAVDISAIKGSDAPGTLNAPVNGFYGEEICQLSRYAGLSDKVSIFGIFEFDPKKDKKNKTAELSAQMIWYFIQSFYNRKNEYPDSVIKKFKKYIVSIDGISDPVNFYKSTKSGRWWAEVNYAVRNDERSKLIACSYEDYIKATRNEIPNRWLNHFNKLN